MTKNHLLYKILKYGFENETFTLDSLREDLQLNSNEVEYVRKLSSNTKGESNDVIILFSTDNKESQWESDRNKWQYMLAPTYYSHYIEMIELEEARKTSIDAKRLAWIAIWISLSVGLMQIIIPLITKK